MSMVARYDAIGSRATHRHVVQPSRVRSRRSTPFATTSTPSGTVTSKVYEALSSGWSLTGNQAVADSGSPATMAPSVVAMKPAGRPKPGISNVTGTPP